MGTIIEKDMEAPVTLDKLRCVTEEKPDGSYDRDIEFAWGVVKHLTSNAIFVARNGVSLGFGIGQTNRVGSVRLAVEQAGERARGAVLASDAFFPATDNIETAAKAGIKVIVQPGGSIKDDDVIAACNKHKIAMLFTGQRCFRH
jgi:phosphoribosylaminoimidazolecarboxamide formyltransferase/IMP cyclohydrolase